MWEIIGNTFAVIDFIGILLNRVQYFCLQVLFCFVKANLRMPAQSGDPVSAALHRSLSSVKKCNRGADGLDSMLVASAKQVLFTEIKYELTKSYNTSILYDLKSKYIVLTPACGSNGVLKSEEIRVKDNQVIIKKVTKDPVSLPSPKKVLYPPDSVQVGWKGILPVGSGFVNLGNTCYLNSTLQALFHVPAFVNWLLNDTAHSSKCQQLNGMTHSECLICAMSKTLQCAHRYTGTAIKPVQIYSKLKSICKHLVHGHQEDAHEFLRYLMEGMEKSYLSIFNGLKLDTYSKETTPLNQIFGGYLRTEVTCLECDHVSTTFQHFQDLLLDIRQAGSVEEALDSYFGRERLGDGDQAYKCEQCHRRVAATKKFSLERPPKALCIQLKRFGAMGGKNSKHINLKQYLDLGRFRYSKGANKSSQPLRYKLVAMVTHLGPSASCGHYTAVGLTCHGSYYLFDDSIVRPLSIHNVLNTNAYIILYEQENPEPEKQESPSKTITTNGYTNGIEIKVGNSSRPPSPPEKSAPSQIPSQSPKPAVSQLPKLAICQSPKPTNSQLPKPTVCQSPKPAVVNQQSPKPQSPKQPQLVRVPPPSPKSSQSTPTKNFILGPTPIPLSQPSKSDRKSELRLLERNSEREKGGPPLVPYLSESSESESEVSSLTSPERPVTPPSKRVSVTPTKPSKTIVVKSGLSFGNGLDKTSSAKVEVDVAHVGWEVTPARLRPPSPTNSIGSSSGRWSVTSSNERDRSYDKGSPTKSLPVPSSNSNKKWDGSRSTSAIHHLLKPTTHRVYGSASVSSWSSNNRNGNEVDVEIEIDRSQSLKRPHSSSYDDELDRGKVKKQKKYHPYKDQHPRNKFQEFQNRKNSWGNGGGRVNFYRQYTYERSRNHSGYYRGNQQRRWH